MADIQESFARQFSRVLPREQLYELIDQLDSYYFLDSESFAQLEQETLDAFQQAPIREMAHSDTCYSSQPEEFTRQLSAFFKSDDGPGLPSVATQERAPIRGLIAPHIDLRVGGPTYAWAYKELAERCDADLFIMLGTLHYGTNDFFVSTIKDYNTPLGPVRTDRDFLRTLQGKYSENLFSDELLHRNEHSLEFQMVFLQYMLGAKRDFSVVPILVSSFHRMVVTKTPPTEILRVSDFLAALKQTISQTGHKVCVVAGVDFAHVGQKFGDQGELTEDFLGWAESEDQRLIRALENVDHSDFFDQIAKDGDRRRVCGFSSMYTMLLLLELIGVKAGKLLKYDRSIDPHTQSSVSFASLAFY